jgi:hypothetical protein
VSQLLTSYSHTGQRLTGRSYSQSHKPLHEQETIEGHSVRALYLTTAAADIGGDFLKDAQRLFTDAVDKKMYATGGFGSRPRVCLRTEVSSLLIIRPKASTSNLFVYPNLPTRADVMLKLVRVSLV